MNGESARYKELKEDKFYLPKDWNGIEAKTLNDIDNNFFKYYETWKQILEGYTEMGNRLYHDCLKDLTPILGRKRAKESARYFKTYNSVITTDCIMNMSCFANFYKLRHSDKAQKEISDIAEEMMILLENIEGNPFETTLKMIK
jgi:thymidylate synthase ThyX